MKQKYCLIWYKNLRLPRKIIRNEFSWFLGSTVFNFLSMASNFTISFRKKKGLWHILNGNINIALTLKDSEFQQNIAATWLNTKVKNLFPKHCSILSK